MSDECCTTHAHVWSGLPVDIGTGLILRERCEQHQSDDDEVGLDSVEYSMMRRILVVDRLVDPEITALQQNPYSVIGGTIAPFRECRAWKMSAYRCSHWHACSRGCIPEV